MTIQRRALIGAAITLGASTLAKSNNAQTADWQAATGTLPTIIPQHLPINNIIFHSQGAFVISKSWEKSLESNLPSWVEAINADAPTQWQTLTEDQIHLSGGGRIAIENPTIGQYFLKSMKQQKIFDYQSVTSAASVETQDFAAEVFKSFENSIAFITGDATESNYGMIPVLSKNTFAVDGDLPNAAGVISWKIAELPSMPTFFDVSTDWLAEFRVAAQGGQSLPEMWRQMELNRDGSPSISEHFLGLYPEDGPGVLAACGLVGNIYCPNTKC